MTSVTLKLCLMMAFSLFSASSLAEKVFSSSTQVTNLVELYTSEGCSSCPPADRFFTSLKRRDGLFENFIPVAFHVDYWDGLGWKDRFSRSFFTQRQRKHVLEGNAKQVYTPGFVVNNKEWRAWFSGKRHWNKGQENPGKLTARLDGQSLQVDFDAPASAMQLNVAYLGNGLRSRVSRGENRDKELHHDFVVLDLNQYRAQVHGSDSNQWKVTLPDIPQKGQSKTALVVWVSPVESVRVIQATGGYLD